MRCTHKRQSIIESLGIKMHAPKRRTRLSPLFRGIIARIGKRKGAKILLCWMLSQRFLETRGMLKEN